MLTPPSDPQKETEVRPSGPVAHKALEPPQGSGWEGEAESAEAEGTEQHEPLPHLPHRPTCPCLPRWA